MDDDQVQTLRDRQAGLYDARPRSLLDPSFDIFDVLRWATHTAYPEARIPETPMPAPPDSAECTVGTITAHIEVAASRISPAPSAPGCAPQGLPTRRVRGAVVPQQVTGEEPEGQLSDREQRMRKAAPELYRALKWCTGILCESGNLNNYRNLSDEELGKLWVDVAEHAGHLLNRIDGLEPWSC